MEVISRKQASARGLKRYYTGKTCKHGHDAERIVDNGTCIVCHYACAAIQYEKNKDKRIQGMRNYRKQNWEKVKSIQHAWKEKNQGDGAMRASKRRAAVKLGGILDGDEFNDFVFFEAHSIARRREAATGIKWNVDHMIPMKSKDCCGLHVWFNIQVIPARLNNVKHNKKIFTEPLDWLASL